MTIQQERVSDKVLLLIGIVAIIMSTVIYAIRLPRSGDSPAELAGADDRFGVILSDGAYHQRTLGLLGVRWYLDYSYEYRDIPEGHQKVLKVRTNQTPDRAGILAAAAARPGSYWLIGNEPNAPGQDDIPPEQYASAFHDYVSIILEGDPSARIVGPEVLNFETSCTGCAGFTTGRAYIDAFRSQYRRRFGIEPPIDVWSIHTYDLDWERLPQGDYVAQTREIEAFHRYLDSDPALRGKPIWLTEFSVLWAYNGVRWTQQPDGSAVATPGGALRTDRLSGYLDQMVRWLQTHAGELNLQRWFLFSSHAYTEPWATASGSIALVSTDSQSIPHITTLGTRYRTLAHEPQP